MASGSMIPKPKTQNTFKYECSIVSKIIMAIYTIAENENQ